MLIIRINKKYIRIMDKRDQSMVSTMISSFFKKMIRMLGIKQQFKTLVLLKQMNQIINDQIFSKKNFKSNKILIKSKHKITRNGRFKIILVFNNKNKK